LAAGTALSVDVDADGRYHLPCSVVPNSAIGSNIVLKLDTGTLPVGFKMTTENPRSVRMTRGKTAKANFGVHLDRIVRIDLHDCLFQGNFMAGTQGTEAGLDQIIELLKGEKATLRISYRTVSASKWDIEQRLADVVRRIERRWDVVGNPYALTVESEVVKIIGSGSTACN